MRYVLLVILINFITLIIILLIPFWNVRLVNVMNGLVIYIIKDELSDCEFVLCSPILCRSVVSLEIFNSMFSDCNDCSDLVSDMLKYKTNILASNNDRNVFTKFEGELSKTKDSLHVLIHFDKYNKSECFYLVRPPDKLSVIESAEDAIKRYVEGNIVSVFSKDYSVKTISNDGLLFFLERMAESIKKNELFVVDKMTLN
jgi:hypothetical protein